MQLNEEEDEKTPDPFTYDQRLYESLRKVFEMKSEEIMKVFCPNFVSHILQSSNYSGVIIPSDF
jgi:hypothetical protein